MLKCIRICSILILLIGYGSSFRNNSSDIVTSKVIDITQTNNTNYNYEYPDTTFILAPLLNEISGLTYHQSKNILIAHNDEEGVFYELDLSNGKIINSQKFNTTGDYEGIEDVGDKIIMVKNNGTLYFYDEKSMETEVIKTKISSKNDVEGLGYYQNKNQLLLACKGQSMREEKSKKEKCIYSFDLSDKKLIHDPFITITDKVLKSWIKENYKARSKTDLEKTINRIKKFAPSGIAVSNDQKEFYIISARGSSLLIYTKEEFANGAGKSILNLKSIHFFNEKTIPQPEGICFDNQNNLYISTEGQGYSGKVFKFNYHD